MSDKNQNETKEKDNGKEKSLKSGSISLLICFAIVASAAVVGFVQARRTVYDFNVKSLVTQHGQYSANDRAP